MKIKIPNELIPLNLLVLVLIIIKILFTSNVLQIALGLPFLLFFPGYALTAALFPRREGMDVIARVTLSFGMSIAVVPLIGLILNYTPWGITLESILYSVAFFTFTISAAAWVRRKRLWEQERFSIEFQLRLPGWSGSAWDKVLSVVLVIAIVGALGTLGYVLATPKVGEKFTEFYILGEEGKATDYPLELKIEEVGKVVVGIINHEHQGIHYRVEVWTGGTSVGKQIPVMLQHGEKWEQEVNFIPVEVGENQKVEFLLYKNKESEPYRKLHLWNNVKE